MHWLNAAAITPEFAESRSADSDEDRWAREEILQFIKSDTYRFRLRILFTIMSSLAVLWVYLLLLVWRERFWEAFFASSLTALSFELSYHARWIAPDAVMTQFAALTLLLIILAWKRESSRWLVMAAVAAGLTCGTKYTGGILLLPVLLLAWQKNLGPGRWKRIVSCGLMFSFAFFITTPGAVLHTSRFWEDVSFEMSHYGLGHYGYTVDGGLSHLEQIFRYLAWELPSAYPTISIALTLFALWGVCISLRRQPFPTFLILTIPLVYIPYLGQQNVMFVRNYLLLLPVLAVFSAVGASSIYDLLPGKALRHIFALALAVALLANARYLDSAATSIREKDPATTLAQFGDWLDDNPTRRVLTYGSLTDMTTGSEWTVRANLTSDPIDDIDSVALFSTDVPDFNLLPSNIPGGTLAEFDPLDRNFEYYTNWQQPRLTVVTMETARAWGLLE